MLIKTADALYVDEEKLQAELEHPLFMVLKVWHFCISEKFQLNYWVVSSCNIHVLYLIKHPSTTLNAVHL